MFIYKIFTNDFTFRLIVRATITLIPNWVRLHNLFVVESTSVVMPWTVGKRIAQGILIALTFALLAIFRFQTILELFFVWLLFSKKDRRE